MDLEYAMWQMWLMCTNPKVVYRHTMYRKQTKNQWARDDPAVVVLTSILVFATSSLYCCFFSKSFKHSVYVVACAGLIDYVGLGALIATGYWFVSNRFLRTGVGHSHAIEQRVEWLYAFDVHCNAFFPLFLQLYAAQLVLSPVLLAGGFIPRMLSCALYAVALVYYQYCTFIGFNALPFLEAMLFLYPIAGIAFLAPMMCLFGFNPTKFVLGIYFG